jgi:hypothetical protein
MLDVHPSQHAAQTWREFVTHIATIVVGLVIAVGLEQGVEHLHHRHQVEIARERLRDEVKVNQRILLVDQVSCGQLVTRLDEAITLLQNADRLPLPERVFDASVELQGFYNAAYSSARDSGALGLMPYDEAAMESDAYLSSDLGTTGLIDVLREMAGVKAAIHGRTFAEIPQAERASLLQTLSTALGRVQFAKTSLDGQQPEWDALLSGHFRNDLGGAISK